jgi:hypothetical protein
MHDTYLKLMAWAQARYTRDGALIKSRGGCPSRYSRIEDLAATRYLGCAERHPGLSLSRCHR